MPPTCMFCRATVAADLCCTQRALRGVLDTAVRFHAAVESALAVAERLVGEEEQRAAQRRA